MFFLLGGNEKKGRKAEARKPDRVTERVKELFLSGRFPVVTTDSVEGKQIAKVLGFVCCRGYDSEDAFFGMASRAVTKGAHAIVGYCENVAFHPDGSKYFSCFGTAVMFEWEEDEKFGAAALFSRPAATPADLDPAPTQPVRPTGRLLNRTLDDDPALDLDTPPSRQWREQ